MRMMRLRVWFCQPAFFLKRLMDSRFCLEDIRQIVRNSHCAPQQNQHTGEMDKAKVILCFHFPTDQHAPERWQPAEETFHLPAAFLSAEWSSVLGLILTIASMGCHYFQ